MRDNTEEPIGSGFRLDDKWYYFSVYLSPGYDNRFLQEDLTSEQYAQWVANYVTDPVYGAQFISAFSNNWSFLAKNAIGANSSGMSDITTM